MNSPRVIYSSNYDIKFHGLEKFHSFDSCKYSKAWKELKKMFGSRLKDLTLYPKHSVNKNDLLTVHPESYLNALESSRYLAKALEFFPLAFISSNVLDKYILLPMRWATMGTVLGAYYALECGATANLSGGYHHASKQTGQGFCIYSDISVAIMSLRKSGRLNQNNQVLVIDLDAHQGNGLERVFFEDNNITFFDMYNADIYPQDSWAKKRIDYEVCLASGDDDQVYLEKLKRHLPLFLKKNREASIAFYIAGTDIYCKDPLGRLSVSLKGILERDIYVFQSLNRRKIPFTMTLGGGYTKDSYKLVSNTICTLLEGSFSYNE